MKEATGELNMTVVTIVAIAAIAGILALMWPSIKKTITGSWGSTGETACTGAGGTWNNETGTCTNIPESK